MQTTLRVDDHLYREAKVQASREGISLSQLFNQALKQRIFGLQPNKNQKVSLPVFKGDLGKKNFHISPDEIKEMLNQID